MVDRTSRVPPYSEEGERGVLGCLLREAETAIDACTEQHLHAGHFFVPAHRILIEEVSKMMGKNMPVELLSVADWLKRTGNLDKIGGSVFLNRLYDTTPTVANVGHYVELVMQDYMRRDIIQKCQHGAQEAYTCEDPETLRAEVEGNLAAMNTRIDPMSPLIVFEEIETDIQNSMDGNPVELGLDTGFPVLNETLGGGLRPGGVYWLTGKPKAGKTSLKNNMIRTQLLVGKKVADLTLEMTVRQEFEKLCGIHCDFNVARVISGKGLAVEVDNLQYMADAKKLFIESGLLQITDKTSVRTLSEFRSWARRMVCKFGCELICIDYLQKLVVDGEESMGIEAATTAKSAAVQDVAASLGVPVLCVAATNADGLVRGSRMADYDGFGHIRLEYNDSDDRAAPFYEYDVDAISQNARFGIPHRTLALRCKGSTGKFYDRNQPEPADIDELDDNLGGDQPGLF